MTATDGLQHPAEKLGNATAIVATPWPWCEPAAVPRRQWLYDRYLARGTLSLTVAPGGVGKTALSIVESLALATGNDLLGQISCEKPLRIWLVNLEEPQEELDRRIAATCEHFGLTSNDIAGRLFVHSGIDCPLSTTTVDDKGRVVIDEASFQNLENEMLEHGLDVIVVDPFVSTHSASEIDNTIIDALAKRWGRLAKRTNAAVVLVHHTRKSNGSTHELDADSVRGASALVSAARVVRVLQPMRKSDAEFAGIPEKDRKRYFCASYEKHNLSAQSGDRTWFELVGVSLGNGNADEGQEDDEIGVVTAWQGPDAFSTIDRSTLLKALERAIASAKCAWDPRASDWIGGEIAPSLGMNIVNTSDKARLKKLLQRLEADGTLVREERPCSRNRRIRPFYVLKADALRRT